MMKISFKKPKKACKETKSLKNTEKLPIKEVSEEELEHIAAARLLEPKDLAFFDLFGDKRRIIIDFNQFDSNTPLGIVTGKLPL